ncbi:MAG TPA: MBL fold metallo-hydrolase [Polyangiaceae bacterium]|jgi:L-ascorbate metabolism protein UlaG (beta-lactamase superfamily)
MSGGDMSGGGMSGARILPLLLLAGLAGCSEPLVHTTDAAPVPAGSPAAVAASPRATDRFSTPEGELVVVPIEHATLLFLWQGRAIYVDPASPAVDDATLPPADLVLVTSPRYDHLDPFALSQVRKAGTVVVGPPAVDARTRVDVVLREGDTRSLPPGIGVTAFPAYSLARGPGPGLRYQVRGQGVGYVLELGGLRVYVSGDTECTPEMKALANVDVAFVSLNVPYAMTPGEANECVAAFRPKVVFPYAYRHAVPATLDRAALGPGIEVRRRELYPRAGAFRARAYVAFTHGQWGYADDLLDAAKQRDPEGDADWRVQWTRQWLREYERPWPW